MEDVNLQKQSRYFFLVSFLIIALVSIYLVKPFITTIISAVLLSYIFYPLYNKLKDIMRSENVAAFISTFLIIIIIIIPLVFAANALLSQSIDFFYEMRSIDLTKAETFLAKFFSGKVDIQGNLQDLFNRMALSVAKATSDFVVSIPNRILQFFVMIFLMFYLFKEGPWIIERIEENIPLKESHKKYITKKFSSVVYASLYGLVLTAFIQAGVGALGLWIFGVPSPILWGLVMFILAMIPFIGSALVWFPAALFKIFSGDTFNGFGLLLYGLLIVSTIDNVIRPKIIGAKGKIHPILALLGVLGGLRVFGFLGIIIGPLILAILNVFLDIYILEKDGER